MVEPEACRLTGRNLERGYKTGLLRGPNLDEWDWRRAVPSTDDCYMPLFLCPHIRVGKRPRTAGFLEIRFSFHTVSGKFSLFAIM